MSSFNESFYTTDFDQEMMDFIEDAGYGEIRLSEREWNVLHTVLVYSDKLNGFWTEATNSPEEDYSEAGYTLLTKQQFKEKIGMPQDNIVEEITFGKKNLVDGMFVKIKGEFFMVIGETLSSYNLHIPLEHYNENLEDYSDTDWDITEVFVVNDRAGVAPLKHFLEGNGLKSIWKRTPPKSEKVIKLEKLIMQHEEQLEATKKLLAEELCNV